MATIFTKIIKGEIPSYKIAESDEYFAFLDIRPLAKGHTLVVPKEEIDYLFDLSDGQLAGIMAFSKKVAKAIEAAVACKRVGVLVVGTEVPHAHIHLVPFQRESQMNITSNPIEVSEEEMKAVAASIREHL
jgi:histidine triad (HIT) family protein